MTSISGIRTRIECYNARRISDPDATEAAVAAVLVDASPTDPQLLLIKRATCMGDPWSGHMAFPGGRREEADKSLLETVCRETAEETGIRLAESQLLGELDDLRPRGQDLPAIVVRPFVFALSSFPKTRTNEEVEQTLWVRLLGLTDTVCRTDVEVDGTILNVRSYVIDDHVVWGLTERIIKSLMELLD